MKRTKKHLPESRRDDKVRDSGGLRLLKSFLNEEIQSVRKKIAFMGPDDISDEDIYDEETGEIHLAVGKPAKSSPLHPGYAPQKKMQVDDETEESDVLSNDDKLYDAIEKYADSWSDYSAGGDDDMQGVAMDAAQEFFHLYPQWKTWASQLGYTKSDVQSMVADRIYDAMLESF